MNDEVVVHVVMGNPKSVRRASAPAAAVPMDDPPVQASGIAAVAAQARPPAAPQPEPGTLRELNPPQQGAFLNPYALVPSPKRDVDDKVWGDHSGPGHHRLAEGCWSGTIPITITAESPLLILDQGAAGENEPVPLRLRDGQPVLEWSSVKGSLRSVFEALTNSRYGVVDDRHYEHLAMRQPANAALDLLPAEVITPPTSASPGTCRVVTQLEPAKYPPAPNGSTPTGEAHPDVWVPAYTDYDHHYSVLGGLAPGTEVYAWAWLVAHRNHHGADYWHWRASDIARDPKHLPATPSPCPAEGRIKATSDRIKIRGRLLVGHKSFGKKHDERIVVSAVLSPATGIRFSGATLPISQDVARRWTAVYDSYHEASKEPGPFSPGRHVRRHADERILTAGQLAFARTTRDRTRMVTAVTDLFPVMIGRETFPATPSKLLEASGHLPPDVHTELSPADRLFGWARTRKRGDDSQRSVDAYRGHLWCDSIGLIDPEADMTTRFTDPLWLPTLNSPKPSQFRFRMLGPNSYPLKNGTKKAVTNGYAPGNHLGRAFYWTHRVPDDYWNWDDTTLHAQNDEVGYEQQPVGNRYREYLAPLRTKKLTTKAIQGWVKPGTQFTAYLRMENAEQESLGAFLWMLTEPDIRFGLGTGKPLGFGTVTIRADLERAELMKSDQRRSTYASWTPSGRAVDKDELAALAENTTQALDPRVVKSLLRIGSGIEGVPVHYPRVRVGNAHPVPPRATSYEWFVSNERSGRKSLPAPDSDSPWLSYYPPG
ncbi:MAG TPA: TIGR03986 family CRISPR-associated RAMP protein [Actinomycetaceae bacterium]|nr:TIGR03986 family CRISPR-associated RAMP protein [Actinomycetaceae bacterium]